MKKALLLGASPILDSSFLRNYSNEDYLFVAIDGGYNIFLKEDIEPDILIGDFDTLNKQLIRSPKTIIELNPMKDDTDTFYIIKKLINDGFKEFYIYGCLGGKLDHTIANIQLLRYLSSLNIKSYMFQDDSVLFTLTHEDKLFKENNSGLVSIFALSSTTKLSLSNFKYNLDSYTMTNDVPLGISNEFIKSKQASIKIHEGTALIYTKITNL